MLKKLDYYIIKKFLITFFFALALIMLITVIFDVSEKLEDFIDKKASLYAIIFEYYIYFIPYFANMFSYLFVFISVVFFTSRMAYQNEFVVMLASGISFNRIMRPYFIAAGILSVLSFLLGAYLLPIANKHRLAFEDKYIHNQFVNNQENIHKQIKPGTYIYMEHYSVASQTGYAFSMEKFDTNNTLTYKLISDFIQWDTTKNKWKIFNYYTRRYNGLLESLQKGSEKDTLYSFYPTDFAKREDVIQAMNLKQLDDHIAELKLQGSPNVEKVKMYKYQLFSMPFATFILTLIGVALSARKVRGGTGLHIGLGLAISFSYILFMQLSVNIVLGVGINTILGVWIPNLIYALIGLVLYRFAPK